MMGLQFFFQIRLYLVKQARNGKLKNSKKYCLVPFFCNYIGQPQYSMSTVQCLLCLLHLPFFTQMYVYNQPTKFNKSGMMTIKHKNETLFSRNFSCPKNIFFYSNTFLLRQSRVVVYFPDPANPFVFAFYLYM